MIIIICTYLCSLLNGAHCFVPELGPKVKDVTLDRRAIAFCFVLLKSRVVRVLNETELDYDNIAS